MTAILVCCCTIKRHDNLSSSIIPTLCIIGWFFYRTILGRCPSLLLRDKDQDKARGGGDDESEETMIVENALPTLPPTDLNVHIFIWRM